MRLSLKCRNELRLRELSFFGSRGGGGGVVETG